MTHRAPPSPRGDSDRQGALGSLRCPRSPSPPPAAEADSTAQRQILRIAAWIVGTLVVLAALQLAGIDVVGWFEELWDTLTEISIGYIILGCFFQGLQTTLTALGWYGILRYAYPGGTTYHAGARRVRDRRRTQQLRSRRTWAPS